MYTYYNFFLTLLQASSLTKLKSIKSGELFGNHIFDKNTLFRILIQVKLSKCITVLNLEKD